MIFGNLDYEYNKRQKHRVKNLCLTTYVLKVATKKMKFSIKVFFSKYEPADSFTFTKDTLTEKHCFTE